ncbi:hypothetical protein CYY_000263 [Polysphondylium violaceum]|uniref:Uncharacterized protein n=1 Tax=Polysphondylium violaceum TaxID=133409 RepID=A0A8J4Q224_9MYCE|nr:hypothetical protein CYY_000263 [Polysphondylium violaceum]
MSQESDVWKNLCIRLQNPTSFSQSESSNILSGIHTPVLVSITPRGKVPDLSITVQDHPIGTPQQLYLNNIDDVHIKNILNENLTEIPISTEITPTTNPTPKAKKSKSSCEIL